MSHLVMKSKSPASNRNHKSREKMNFLSENPPFCDVVIEVTPEINVNIDTPEDSRSASRNTSDDDQSSCSGDSVTSGRLCLEPPKIYVKDKMSDPEDSPIHSRQNSLVRKFDVRDGVKFSQLEFSTTHSTQSSISPPTTCLNNNHFDSCGMQRNALCSVSLPEVNITQSERPVSDKSNELKKNTSSRINNSEVVNSNNSACIQIKPEDTTQNNSNTKNNAASKDMSTYQKMKLRKEKRKEKKKAFELVEVIPLPESDEWWLNIDKDENSSKNAKPSKNKKKKKKKSKELESTAACVLEPEASAIQPTHLPAAVNEINLEHSESKSIPTTAQPSMMEKPDDKHLTNSNIEDLSDKLAQGLVDFTDFESLLLPQEDNFQPVTSRKNKRSTRGSKTKPNDVVESQKPIIPPRPSMRPNPLKDTSTLKGNRESISSNSWPVKPVKSQPLPVIEVNKALTSDTTSQKNPTGKKVKSYPATHPALNHPHEQRNAINLAAEYAHANALWNVFERELNEMMKNNPERVGLF